MSVVSKSSSESMGASCAELPVGSSRSDGWEVRRQPAGLVGELKGAEGNGLQGVLGKAWKSCGVPRRDTGRELRLWWLRKPWDLD